MRKTSARRVPRPFLKWAGGKGQLLNELLERVEQARPFNRYHEPFVGGGALFFELCRLGRLGRRQAFLSDSNSILIESYEAVRDSLDDLIALLERHKALHDKDYYYEMRKNVPATPVERAARVIYLNKTCFNGLFRLNSKGEFNVPIGKYTDPVICDEKNLASTSEALKKARLFTESFTSVLDRAEPDDLVYFDPPYDPMSATANFTTYDKSGFGVDDQKRLAEVAEALHEKGVKVILSNSMTPLIADLYKKFRIETVKASRTVNSRAGGRGKIDEALITNFGKD